MLTFYTIAMFFCLLCNEFSTISAQICTVPKGPSTSLPSVLEMQFSDLKLQDLKRQFPITLVKKSPKQLQKLEELQKKTEEFVAKTNTKGMISSEECTILVSEIFYLLEELKLPDNQKQRVYSVKMVNNSIYKNQSKNSKKTHKKSKNFYN